MLNQKSPSITHQFDVNGGVISLLTTQKDSSFERVTYTANKNFYSIYFADCYKNYEDGKDINALLDVVEKYKKKILPQIMEMLQSKYENREISLSEYETLKDLALETTIRNNI